MPLAVSGLGCTLLAGFHDGALGTFAYISRFMGAVAIAALSLAFSAVRTRLLRRSKKERTLREQALRETDKLSHAAHEEIQQLEVLARQLMRKQEEQQHSISRELHDNIAQVLSAVTTRISLANTTPQTPAWLKKELQDLQEHLGSALTDIRTLARELRPALLDHFGFAAALEKHAQDFCQRTSIDIELEVDSAAASELHPENLTHLFRVVQEAMQNIEEHSGATQARLTLAQRDGELHLEIGDNGRAFTRDRIVAAQRDGHLGLLGMRERAELLGGSFFLEATSGQGTTIRIAIPNKTPHSSTHETDHFAHR